MVPHLPLFLKARDYSLSQLGFLLAAYSIADVFIVLGASYRALIPLLDTHTLNCLPDPTLQYSRVRMMGSLRFVAASIFFQTTGLIDGTSSRFILAGFLAISCL